MLNTSINWNEFFSTGAIHIFHYVKHRLIISIPIIRKFKLFKLISVSRNFISGYELELK